MWTGGPRGPVDREEPPRAWLSVRAIVAVAGLLALSSSAFAQASEALPYRDASRPVAERVRDLLGRMTLEEKFWQLFMIPGDLDNPANDYSHGVFGLQISRGAATPTDPARAHAERINAIQRYFVERTRLGIPIIPFEEAVHGLVRDGATVFPQAIALAATWDTALMTRVATAIARETRSRGIRQVLSPVINIANDVRWGRVEETYGEDPVLTSRMARVVRERVRASRASSRRRSTSSPTSATAVATAIRSTSTSGCWTRCTFRRFAPRSRQGTRGRS